jgi:hypothetical protein
MAARAANQAKTSELSGLSARLARSIIGLVFVVGGHATNAHYPAPLNANAARLAAPTSKPTM